MQPKQGSGKGDFQDQKMQKGQSFIPDDGVAVSIIKVIYQNSLQLDHLIVIQENIRNEFGLLQQQQIDVELLQKLDLSCKKLIDLYNQLQNSGDDISQLLHLTKTEIVLFFDFCDQIEQEGRLFQNNLNVFFANIIQLKQDLNYGSYIKTQPGSILQSDQLPKSQLILTQSQQELAFEQHEYSLLQLDLNSKIIAKLSKLERKNKLEDPRSSQISTPIDCDNKEVLFYVLRDQFMKAGQEFKKSLQHDDLLLYSFQAMYSLAWDSRKHYQLTLDEQDPHYTYENISTNKHLRHLFISNVKKALAQAYEVEQTSVTINLIEKGSIIVHFSILDPEFDGVPDPQLLKRLFGNVNPKVEKSLLFQRASLSMSDFDSRFDMSWDNHAPGEYDIRGPDDHNGVKYFFPVGWYGHALNVLDKYGQDNCWLAMDGNPKEWCVLFHGTKFDRTTARGILDEGLRPGCGQNYESEICLKTKKRVGRGVYFSNHIEVSHSYCEPTIIGNYRFSLVFQARVNPSAIRQIQKDPDPVYTDRQMTMSYISQEVMTIDNSGIQDRKSIENPYANDYFVVNVDEGIPRNQSDIRPYRILLRKEKISY